MTNAEEKKPLCERLNAYESGLSSENWYEIPTVLRDACELTEEDIPELIAIAQECDESIDEIDEFEEDEDDDEDEDEDEQTGMLPVFAWRALGCLKAADCVAPLLDNLDTLAEDEDEWALTDFPYVFGLIGVPAREPLKRFVLDNRHAIEARVCAVDSLGKIALQSDELRGPIVMFLIDLLTKCNRRDERVNSAVLCNLMDLKAKEAAQAIERAFAANCIDHGMAGDWETVRLAMGVDSLGLPMPTDPINSMEEFRKASGINCFSKVPLFDDGDLDEEAMYRYLDTAIEAYSKSSEAALATSSEDDFGWIRIFLEFAVTYQCESVRTISADDAKEILFQIFPRKVSTDANSAAAIVDALTRFWTFIQREHSYKNAGDVLAVLKDNSGARLRRELSNSSNFGMAKSIFMMASDEGVDLRNPDEIQAFIATYNQRISGQSEPSRGATSTTTSVPQPKMSQEEFQKFKKDRHKILSSKKKKK